MDEYRIEYHATLWVSPVRAGQTIEQCWFSGAYGDVGSSYREPEARRNFTVMDQRRRLRQGYPSNGIQCYMSKIRSGLT
ncbi:MAG: DUF2235 domain-containing protein [Nitrospira sp.]|nr:DUF2235 domain-containing protein [Nitrospira sp.]